MSALAALFATAILVSQRVTWPRVLGLTAAAAGVALVRDSLVWVIVLLAIVVAGFAIVRGEGRKIVTLGFLLLAVSGIAVVGQAAARRNAANVEHVLFVRVFPYPDRVRWFADHGMPDARVVRDDARRARADGPSAPVVPIDPEDPRATSLVHWMRTKGLGVYVEWLLTHPGYVLTEPLQEPERTYNNAGGHLAFYAAADRTDLPAVSTVFDPGAGFVLVAALGAIALAVRWGTWRERWWQIVALLGVLGLIEMLVAWHGDGMETARHGIEGSVEVRLAVLVLLVAGTLPRSRPSERNVDAHDRAGIVPPRRHDFVSSPRPRRRHPRHVPS
jgi:hypothetical protein